MKIAIVDLRWDPTAGPDRKLKYRATLLAQAVRRETRDVRCFEHISKLPQDFDPDLVILHVGEEQTGWQGALSGAWKDKVVVCYTGQPRPPIDCLNDVRENLKHVYYPDPVIDWRAANAIARFVEQAERALQLEGQGQAQQAAGQLQQAKEALMGFDPVLEAKLELLCGLLAGKTIQQCLQDPNCQPVTRDPAANATLQEYQAPQGLALEQLIKLRDKLLEDKPDWAR